MKKEVISNKQMQILIFAYSIGAYLLFSMGSSLKQDAWIPLVISIVFTMPVVIIYGRLMSLYPGKNFFQILEEVFGKIFGKILSFIFIGNSFFTGAYILNDFVNFVKITSLHNTPVFMLMFVIGVLSIWILNEGVQVLVNWTQMVIRIILISIFFSWILLISQMDFTNLQPVFSHDFKSIMKEAFLLTTFPFTEIFLFLNFFDYVDYDNNTKNIFIKPLILGGIVVLISQIIEILLLGGEAYNSFYYASYAAIKRMRFSGEFQRLEIIVAILFTIIQFLEVSFYFLGVSKGIESVFNLRNYRDILTPVVFLSLNFATIMFGSSMESIEFVQDLWKLYGFLMQILFPTIVFIVAFIKKRYFNKSH